MAYTAESANNIMIHGLVPMQRQYVRLSEDTATAGIVASRRKNSETDILTILARKAHDNGISFYKEENGIWLSEPIPPEYMKQ